MPEGDGDVSVSATYIPYPGAAQNYESRPANIHAFRDLSFLDLRWRNWGEEFAQAHGTASINTGEPSFAEPERMEGPAIVTLSACLSRL